jgi:hypothetical protein
MLKGKTGWMLGVLLLAVLVRAVLLAAALGTGEQLVVSGPATEQNVQKLHEVVPAAVEMVDSAVVVLEQGWSGLGPAERELFERYFDPAGTGDLDEDFVSTVLSNYRAVRQRLDGRLVVEFESESGYCVRQRLYYTDLVRVHVCPYFASETRSKRLARGFVHEVVHIALLVVDRPYYRRTSSAYAELTPRGPRSAQLPVVGPLLRELAHSDTLYHPDAYAWFAVDVAELAATGDQQVSDGQGQEQEGVDTSINSATFTDVAVLRHQRYATP